MAYTVFRPEQVTAWSGVILEESARDRIGEGNIVRIQVNSLEREGRDSPYVRIISVDGDAMAGEVLSVYARENYIVKNGETVAFERLDIIEIPWECHDWGDDEWSGNENLADFESLETDRGRMTGVR